MGDVFANAMPVQGLIGGLMIGTASAIMLLGLGRIAGVSGLAARATGLTSNGAPWSVAAAFVIGLPLGAAVITQGATVATFTGKAVRTIAATATAANVVKSIGYAERGVTVAPATGIEIMVRVGFKWRKIAQG